MNLKSCFKPICKQIFRTLIQKVFYAGESLSELFYFFFESGFTQLTVGVPKSMFARTRCTSFCHLAQHHLKDTY